MRNDVWVMQHPSVSPSTPVAKRGAYRKQTKSSTKLGSCLVCHDKATIFNYGALSCQSCKTFFRRNGFHPENVPHCIYNNSCEINKHTRRCCTACRLAKCFTVGMSSDLIRKEEHRYARQPSSFQSVNVKHTLYQRIMAKSQLRLSDQSNDDQYLLLNYEQKIFSNVVRALEIFSAVPKVRALIEDAFASFLGLPFNVTNAIETIDLIYTSMRSFITSTPDFQVLTTDEQCSLFQRNLNGIVNLYSLVVFRDTDVINNSDCIKSFALIGGLEMALEAIRICKQLDLDLTIIKLMLLILAFSSNCSIVDIKQDPYKDSLLTGTHRLLGSQTTYVIVLWKYMVCQYGYYTAALRFAQLIRLSLHLIKYSAVAYMNNIIYHDLIDDLNQKTKELLIINRKEQVHLWGTI